MKFTSQSVAALKAPAGKPYALIFDDATPGFGVKVSKGGSRQWVVQYRDGAGKSRRTTLGRVEVMPLPKARDAARDLLARVRLAETADDRAAAVADLAPPSVADVLDALLALYAAPGTWSRQGGGGLDLEAALYRVIGDPEEDGIGEGEARRREALVTGTFEACGADLVALEAAARQQDVVVAVLRAGRECLAA